jgi:hypothetical protein
MVIGENILAISLVHPYWETALDPKPAMDWKLTLTWKAVLHWKAVMDWKLTLGYETVSDFSRGGCVGMEA